MKGEKGNEGGGRAGGQQGRVKGRYGKRRKGMTNLRNDKFNFGSAPQDQG